MGLRAQWDPRPYAVEGGTREHGSPLRRSDDGLLDYGFLPGVLDKQTQTFLLYQSYLAANIEVNRGGAIGFALGDTKATGRLIDTGGFAKKDRITHRLPIADLADIDDEVKRWLRAAYDLDA